jgi:aryl-alcohol dehydrogenase-like predicted oxidoreductase
MQYTRLGKSDLLVSRICMGCMGFGDPLTGQHSWTLDETASRDIIRYRLSERLQRAVRWPGATGDGETR